MRRTIEADTTNLRKILDEFSLSRSDLEMKIESLNEELVMLKRSHKEVRYMTHIYHLIEESSVGLCLLFLLSL